jgi:hypothetical protein
MRVLDPDQSGEISFEEFMRFIRGEGEANSGTKELASYQMGSFL